MQIFETTNIHSWESVASDLFDPNYKAKPEAKPEAKRGRWQRAEVDPVVAFDDADVVEQTLLVAGVAHDWWEHLSPKELLLPNGQPCYFLITRWGIPQRHDESIKTAWLETHDHRNNSPESR